MKLQNLMSRRGMVKTGKGLHVIAVGVALFLAANTAHALLTVTNGLQLWLMADAGVQTSGSSVTSWNDQSLNLNNAVQATVGKQPTLVPGALNGLPVVAFDGVNDVLDTVANVDLTAGLSIFIVAKNNVRKDWNGLFSIGPNPNNFAQNRLDVYWQDSLTGSGNLVFLANDYAADQWVQTLNAGPSPGTYYQYSVSAQGGSISPATVAVAATVVTQRLNGVDLTIDHCGGNPVGILPNSASFGHVGGGLSTSGGLLDGSIAEMIIYSTPLSAADRNTVEDYLYQKWFVAAPVPEPSSVFLVAMGGLVLAARLRRSRDGSS